MGPIVLCSPFVLAIYQTRSLAHRYFSVLYLNWFIGNDILMIVSYIRRGIVRNKRWIWANIWSHKFSKWLVKLLFESFESQRNPSKAFLVIMKTIFIFNRIKSIIIIVLFVSHVSQLKALSLVTLDGFGTVYKNSDLFVFIFLQQSFDHFWRKVVFCHLVAATLRFFWQSHAIRKSCICTFIFSIVIVIRWAIWFLN